MGGDYGILYASHTAAGGGLPGGQLYASMLTSTMHPVSIAFARLTQVRAGEPPVVRVFLNSQTYLDPPGVPPSVYNGRTFAQLGDIARTTSGYTNLDIVEAPAAQEFNLVGPVRVPTVATVDAALAATATPSLGPYDAAAQNTEEVRTRTVIPLGARLAALAIGRDYTPREFWGQVVSVIRNEAQLLAACGPLVDWARVALVGTTANNAPAPSALVQPPLVPVSLRNPLLDSYFQLVTRDLPGLRPGSNDPMNMVATAMGVLAAEQREARAAAVQQRVEDQAAKMPSDRWKAQIDVLYKLCEVASEEDLPVAYRSLARSSRKDDLTTAQQACDAVARSDPEHTNDAPVINAKMLTNLLAAQWHARDSDDLLGGISCWQVVFLSIAGQGARIEQAEQYTLALQGNASLTLNEAESIRDVKLKVPVTWLQTKTTLISFFHLMWAFLGRRHQLVIAWKAGLDLAESNEAKLEHLLNQREHTHYGAGIMRWLSLRTDAYFRHHYNATTRASATAIEVPDLGDVWKLLLFEEFKPPALPSMYWKKSTPAKDPKEEAMEKRLAMLEAQLSDRKVGSGGGSGGRSISGGGVGGVGNKGGTFKPNDNGNPTTLALAKTRTWRSGEVKRNLRDTNAWPKNDKGRPMCLPWWTKGGCYTGCLNADDHAEAPQSTGENERMCTFLTDSVFPTLN